MARPFDVSVLSNVSSQLAAWEEQYVSETSYRRYRRACAWVMDESAKSIAVGMRRLLPEVLDRPTPWTERAFQYTRSLAKDRGVGVVSTDVYVLPDQSVVLKYHVGEGPNVRSPGDVGLSQDRILVPFADNIKRTQGISLNMHGNVPGGTMARLYRELGGQKAKRAVSGRWSVFKGEINLRGSKVEAIIARPPRKCVENGENTRFATTRRGDYPGVVVPKVVNTDRPRILFLSAPRAVYQPVLQRPYETLLREAERRIPDLMASEVAENLSFRANRQFRA